MRSICQQIVNYAGVGEGGGIAEVRDVVFADLAQDAAHDLARAGLGQRDRLG